MPNRHEGFELDVERAAGEVIDGEAIVINLATGVYYSLAGVGGEIWSMIERHWPVGAMLEQLTASYDVSEARATADLTVLLEELLAQELIRACTPSAPTAIERPAEKKAYLPPGLQIFSDMQDLLALDPPSPGIRKITWSAQSEESQSSRPTKPA